MSVQPCQDECEHLIRIAHAMAEVFANASAQNHSASFDAWSKRATALLELAKLETIDGEQALEDLALDLRQTVVGRNPWWVKPLHDVAAPRRGEDLGRRYAHPLSL